MSKIIKLPRIDETPNEIQHFYVNLDHVKYVNIYSVGFFTDQGTSSEKWHDEWQVRFWIDVNFENQDYVFADFFTEGQALDFMREVMIR